MVGMLFSGDCESEGRLAARKLSRDERFSYSDFEHVGSHVLDAVNNGLILY